MLKYPIKAFAVALLLAVSAPTYAQGDKLLATLQRELRLNFEALQKQTPKPYFMSYRVEDNYQNVIASSFGVVQADNETHTRSLTPQIRVGDMQLDNFKYSTQGMPQQRGGQSAALTTIPLDDDSPAIATNIWTATNMRYQTAQVMYEQARSRNATTTADEDKAPCFSAAPVETCYEAPLPLSQTRIDRKAWEQRLNAVAEVFKAEPSLQAGSATLNFDVVRTWLVNTEGTSVVQNRVTARVMLQVQAQADDGMVLPLTQDFFAFSPDSLPTVDSMRVVAKGLMERVMALKNAPVANPYTGPAILSGPASGVFFHEIFGHRLEGHRLKQGGETFRKMVDKEVLPTSFQVFCDPTLQKYHGQDLNGHYFYDSEGVKARRVDNVVNGVLKEFLMSRVPLDGFPQSNGHGRAANGLDAVSRQSNLCVETTDPKTDAQLRHELRQECRRQGVEYGYYFKSVTSGYTMTGEGGSINSFNVTPLEVYRVYVDGRPDELVRGVSLIGTPLSMFSHIKYGGDTPSTFIGFCGAESGWVPVTANSPAIFVTQIETQRMNKAQGIPRILAAPPFASQTDNGAAEAEVIHKAMKDELTRSLDSLQITGVPRPFWGSYSVRRYRTASITGELGGISKCDVQPWRTNVSVHLPLGNFRKTSDMVTKPMILATGTAEQVDYTSLRRLFWEMSDAAYKSGINQMAQKNNYERQHPLPTSLANIPDMQRSVPITYSEPPITFALDTAKLQRIARELSAMFIDYPNLINSEVKVETSETQNYRLTSENVDLAYPLNRVLINVSTQHQDANNVMMTNGMTLSYLSVDDIPPMDTLKAKVRAFAEDCEAVRQAPPVPEYYKGPVMFTNRAAMMTFTARYLRPNSFFAAPSTVEPKNSLGEKLGKKIMDERLTIRNLTDQTSYNGKPLFGYYAVDADGFKPQAEMTIVDKGVFKTMLNRATPALYAEKSTGSARLYNNPVIALQVGVGTLCITADKATSEDKMLKELLKAAKKKKLDYAYIIDAPNGYSQLRLYQVDVKTGEKKMMKTNNVNLPTSEQIKDLLAISAESVVENFVDPYTYSVVYPKSLIADDVEINKAAFKASPALPLPYPLLRDKK